ncbi:MAG: hypothetical protein RL681_451 [Candidatus Parcubacteria bacterium]|jgi:hypothetical protein
MILNTITQKQAFERWDLLPEVLREALVSEETVAALQHIYDAEHIPEETRRIMTAIVGLAFMGFIHPEEIAEEIKSATTVPPQTATNVSSAIASRILSRYKVELEKIYTPASGSHGGMPTIIQSSPTRQIGAMNLGQAPRPAATAPLASAPMGGISASKPQATGAMPAIAPTKAPQAAPAPAPVMLHREAEFKPIQQGSSSLRNDILSKQTAGAGAVSMFGGGKSAGAAPHPPVAAKIEFSGSEAMKAQMPTVSHTEANIPRVVHYSDMKTPSPFGTAAAPAVPQRPQVPQPVMPSAPRMPQAPLPPSAPQRPAIGNISATPTLPPIPPMPKPAPTVSQQPATPTPPRPSVVKEVNYTQTAATPAPAPHIPVPGMTDLKKIAPVMPPAPPRPAVPPPTPPRPPQPPTPAAL